MPSRPDGRVRLLVSVRNADEAEAALSGGADIIDVKEPSRGPLGCADLSVVRGIVDRIAGRRPVSVSLGELRDDPPVHDLPPGVAFAKIGLAGEARGKTWRPRLAAKFAALPPHVQPVAVAYFNQSRMARAPIPFQVVEWTLENRLPGALLPGVLFDTYMKDRGNLFIRRKPMMSAALEESIDITIIRDAIDEIHAAGRTIALAGSLAGDAFAFAVSMRPDIVGVRGAACDGGARKKPLRAYRVRALADLIAAHNATRG